MQSLMPAAFIFGREGNLYYICGEKEYKLLN